MQDDEFEGLRLGSYCFPTKKNAKAIIFFFPDFGVTARSFGGFFEAFANDSETMIPTFSFDRRGFGLSQGERGKITVNERAFRDYWDFIDAMSILRGYPPQLPRIIVSHGLGSLFAAHLSAQRPGFFKASVNIAPWLGLSSPPSGMSLKLMKAKDHPMMPSRTYKSQSYIWRDEYIST